MAESHAERLHKIENHLIQIDEKLIQVLRQLSHMEELILSTKVESVSEEEEEEAPDSIQFWVLEVPVGNRYFQYIRKEVVILTDYLTSARRYYSEQEAKVAAVSLEAEHHWSGYLKAIWTSDLEDYE
jgi:hypothetical protein